MAKHRQANPDGIIRCPNHGCPLEIDAKDRFATSGRSPCQVSKAIFSWTQQVEKEQIQYVKDKFGNLVPIKTFTIEGEEGPANEV